MLNKLLKLYGQTKETLFTSVGAAPEYSQKFAMFTDFLISAPKLPLELGDDDDLEEFLVNWKSVSTIYWPPEETAIVLDIYNSPFISDNDIAKREILRATLQKTTGVSNA